MMPIRTIVIQRRFICGAIALSTLVALAFAFLSVYSVSLLPPKVQSRHLQIGAAATHVMLDSPRSWILDQAANNSDFGSLAERAELLGKVLAGAPMRERIGRRIGVSAKDIFATSRLTGNLMALLREGDSEQRAADLTFANARHRLEIQSDASRPILNIYTQAPTSASAAELADAAVAELRAHVRETARRDGVNPRYLVVLEQLGAARAGVINAGTAPQIGILTALVVLGVCLGVLLAVKRVYDGWASAGGDHAVAAVATPAVNGRALRVTPAVAGVSRDAGSSEGGDWPHTTRVLPWMIAAFMAILWLVPFNTTELGVSLPFDLKFDRLVLPLIIATWLLTLILGGPGAPRVRATWIHAGIGAFVAVACLGVVLNADNLNQTLEFDLTTKKMLLLVSYAFLFVIVASCVRRSEIRPFLKYTLVLAVICALGTVWEYRFQYNLFYDLTAKLLPMFEVGQPEVGAFDSMNRALTRGPAEHPLEAVAMLAMALPIALVGLMGARDRRTRILYALAACVLLAASISTYRKSALLAPLSVALTLAYFRRRELLRLAPLGVLCVVIIQALSPGALTSILFQFKPDELGVGTVSDRAADYDAIRPDLWSHLLFGRGYGSYDYISYRILDSEILARLVDTGILGLAFLAFMVVTIVGVARPYIHSRHPVLAPPALSVAAAAVVFLVVAFLFDVSSFPHVPYILMSLAGLLAALVTRPADDAGREPGSEPGIALAAQRPGDPRLGRTYSPSGDAAREAEPVIDPPGRGLS